MNQYIQYHKQPFSKFHSIREFNEKFGTNIAENDEYEMYFQYIYDNAKRMQGPDEFLQVKFHTQEEFENMAKKKKSIWSRIKGAAKGAVDIAKNMIPDGVGETIEKIKNKIKKKKLYDAIDTACELESDRDMMKAKIDEILEEYDENAEFTAFDVLNDSHFEEMGFADNIKNAIKFAAKAPMLQAKIVKILATSANNPKKAVSDAKALIEEQAKAFGIDVKKAKQIMKSTILPLVEKTGGKIPEDIKKVLTSAQPTTTNDLDDLLSGDEEEVEEEYDEEVDVAPAVTNIVTEKKKISDLVRKTSADPAAFSKDMRHLIQFRNTSLPLNEQLMKGRPKYLKAIKSYVKGDKNAEVKMSWREGSKTVKIADLKPKMESLKALLRSSPGEMRVVQCL